MKGCEFVGSRSDLYNEIGQNLIGGCRAKGRQTSWKSKRGINVRQWNVCNEVKAVGYTVGVTDGQLNSSFQMSSQCWSHKTLPLARPHPMIFSWLIPPQGGCVGPADPRCPVTCGCWSSEGHGPGAPWLFLPHSSLHKCLWAAGCETREKTAMAQGQINTNKKLSDCFSVEMLGERSSEMEMRDGFL